MEIDKYTGKPHRTQSILQQNCELPVKTRRKRERT